MISKKAPIIHEATTVNPDPTKFMPVAVNSAFPEGDESIFTAEEKAQIDNFINEVPDKNDLFAINYWLDWGDRHVYLEGWCDECLAGTGFPSMEGGEWDEKIQYMVRDANRTLIRKQTDGSLSPPYIAAKLPLTLIEGGFREFEAGEKDWLYGVSWGVYVKPQAQEGNPREVRKMEQIAGLTPEGVLLKLSNPISPHCERILETPPPCWDFKGVRAYVMCKAWDIMSKEKRTRLPVGEAWAEVRKVCKME